MRSRLAVAARAAFDPDQAFSQVGGLLPSASRPEIEILQSRPKRSVAAPRAAGRFLRLDAPVPSHLNAIEREPVFWM
jgi:hypothetical protein